MFVPIDHNRHYVTKEDLTDQPNARPVRWLAPSLETDDRILRGAIDFVKIEEGLTVHFSHAEDLHDLKIETECEPRFCVSVFLEGTVEAFIGGMRIPMPRYDAQARLWTPVAIAYSQNRCETFMRQARKGMRMKKVTISISREWLSGHMDISDPGSGPVRTFSASHLEHVSWTPSAHEVTLAEQIIAAPNRSPFQYRLYLAARVYGLLENAFRHFSDGQAGQPARISGGQDRQKLQAIEHYLSGQRGHWVTAEELASQTGMSRNSLQRLLSRAFGLSTSRFIRRFMLEKAREALERDNMTIAEAAHIAGYSSPANFSTAFKREFGLTPKQLK